MLLTKNTHQDPHPGPETAIATQKLSLLSMSSVSMHSPSSLLTSNAKHRFQQLHLVRFFVALLLIVLETDDEEEISLLDEDSSDIESDHGFDGEESEEDEN